MKKTIAVPVTNGVLSSHFGHCEQFYFASTEDNRITEDYFQRPPAHEPGLYPRWVKEQGATLVITGGMGQKAYTLFTQNKIETIVGALVDTPRKVVEAFLKGELKTTVNACDHR